MHLEESLDLLFFQTSHWTKIICFHIVRDLSEAIQPHLQMNVIQIYISAFKEDTIMFIQ